MKTTKQQRDIVRQMLSAWNADISIVMRAALDDLDTALGLVEEAKPWIQRENRMSIPGNKGDVWLAKAEKVVGK